jgi:hypothetical protein
MIFRFSIVSYKFEQFHSFKKVRLHKYYVSKQDRLHNTNSIDNRMKKW